jgi:2,4-dienoyl-CoA reductase-like NADH-dependent reductase (Old Yellow Enzyme family)
MTKLFTPLTLRELTVPNRVWLSPMCQYSAGGDGVPTDWHLVHLGARVTGGFGLILTESTAVSPDGRISAQDTGLWSDAQVAGWRRITAFAHMHATPIGVQLGHAGRKASTRAPGHGRGSLPAPEGGWTALGPSPLPYRGFAAPAEAGTGDLARIVADFAAAAGRAVDAGFDVVEIHAGHGYLLHQFLSPRSNQRTDAYGGTFDNRVRLLLEVVDAVRGTWPAGSPLLVRVSATDWVEGGWTPEETVDLALLLRDRGVDMLDVSTGGLDPDQRIPVAPGVPGPVRPAGSGQGDAAARRRRRPDHRPRPGRGRARRGVRRRRAARPRGAARPVVAAACGGTAGTGHRPGPLSRPVPARGARPRSRAHRLSRAGHASSTSAAGPGSARTAACGSSRLNSTGPVRVPLTWTSMAWSPGW